MQTVLIKISGELLKGLNSSSSQRVDATFVQSIAHDIKQIAKTHNVHFVIGGGNFFRGARDGVAAGLRQPVADTVGMLATIMNGIMLHEFFAAAGITSTVMSALPIPGVVAPCCQEHIDKACADHTPIIFVGGTGNPYVSTDTAAVIRALQVNATCIWKASNVDGVYDNDPATHKNAQLIKEISYQDAYQQNIRVMDMSAITLAQQHKITLRVFSIFTPGALLNAARDNNFGSTIH